MKSTQNKKKSGTFSFQVKVFSYMLLILVVCILNACKKDSISPTPTPPVVVENKDRVPDQPNIKYTKLNQLVTIGASDGLQKTKIDLNGDGTFEVYAEIYRNNHELNLYFVTDINNSITAGSNNMAKCFSTGTLLSASYQNWYNYGDMYKLITNQQNEPIYISSLTQNTDMYLGVKFVKDHNDYYGWIRFKFTVYTGASNAAIIEIKDCAYEQTQGYGIKTGNTF